MQGAKLDERQETLVKQLIRKVTKMGLPVRRQRARNAVIDTGTDLNEAVNYYFDEELACKEHIEDSAMAEQAEYTDKFTRSSGSKRAAEALAPLGPNVPAHLRGNKGQGPRSSMAIVNASTGDVPLQPDRTTPSNSPAHEPPPASADSTPPELEAEADTMEKTDRCLNILLNKLNAKDRCAALNRCKSVLAKHCSQRTPSVAASTTLAAASNALADLAVAASAASAAFAAASIAFADRAAAPAAAAAALDAAPHAGEEDDEEKEAEKTEEETEEEEEEEKEEEEEEEE